VLAAEDGEVLRRPNGRIIVKVGPRTGSPRLAMGTQELNPGSGILLHKHDTADEILYVQQGSAVARLGDERTPVGPGAAVFIPHGVWHGVDSTGQPVQLLWTVSPPGLEGFFREIGAAPGAPLRQLTPKEMSDIARKHGTVFAPQ
jgi:quercetin dioxygenase-like cupin family protein